MIRTTAVPRSARIGTALVGIAGMLALAGCGATPTDTADTATDTSATDGSTTDSSKTGGSSSYNDGTYSAEGSYATPESVETINVTITLTDDVVTAVEVTGDPQKQESKEFQAKFIGGISDEVVGKDIDELSVSRVAGSSLTSSGFNQAVEAIKQQAAA